MKRLWEVVIHARGGDRFYCFPFLVLFRVLTPPYQLLSRINLARRRKRCSREWKARLISVGNITVGGSGKTPIVMALANKLITSGKKVAIVHSGYGRKSKDNIFISPDAIGDYTIDQTGDEAMMMAEQIPKAYFAVGRDKKQMAAEVDRRFQPEVIIIDDGFQRLDIEKDIDIVTATPELLTAPGNLNKSDKKKMRPFPGGILREKRNALKRADYIFNIANLAKIDGIPETDLPTFNWQLNLTGLWDGPEFHKLNYLQGRKPYLFAGIGSFQRLIDMLKVSGVSLAGHYDFGDHHPYDKIDIDMLRRLARVVKADCYLTTAKDLVKLAHREWDLPLFKLTLEAVPEIPARLDKLLGI